MTTITPRKPRYESLDIWRGVACLSVLIYHLVGDDAFTVNLPSKLTRVLAFGWLGVPMFFVISGYCIAATSDSAGRNKKSFSWYVQRRIRRIYPPYWICLIASALAITFGLVGPDIGKPSGLSLVHWIGNITLTETWLSRCVEGSTAFVLKPAWTLCYEEQFYLVCGLTLFLGRARQFKALLVVTALVVPCCLMSWYTTGMAHGFFFDGLWLHFSAGLLVYYLRNYATRSGQIAGVTALFVVLVIVVGLRVFTSPDIINSLSRCRFFDETAFSILFAFLLLAAQRYDLQIASHWLTKPFLACGIMCYSLYLTHLPVISGIRLLIHGSPSEPPLIPLIELLIELAAALFVGACFYRLVEIYFLNKPTLATAKIENPTIHTSTLIEETTT